MGGLPGWLPTDLAVVVSAGAACPAGRRLTLPLWCPQGACPAGCRLTLSLWCPQGGLAFFVARLPCLSLCFLPPSPYPPSRREGGEYYFISPGATAPGTPALNRLRHLQFLPSMSPAGGLPSLPPAFPAFGLLSCPLSPRPPSPPGKGEIFTFHMQGASPLASPRLRPGGAGSTCQSGIRWGRAYGVADSTQNRQHRLSLGSAGSQGEGGPGERNFGV